MPRPSGVDRTWVLDYTGDYRINKTKISNFLKGIFGDSNFHVTVYVVKQLLRVSADDNQHLNGDYSFWVPKKLTKVCRAPSPDTDAHVGRASKMTLMRSVLAESMRE